MADTTTITLNRTDLAWLALADKALLTPGEVLLLNCARRGLRALPATSEVG